MKIKTTLVLNTYTGEAYTENNKELTLGAALAKIISRNEGSTDPLRDNVLSKEIYNNEQIELNAADFEYIKNAVLKTNLYFTGAKGEILLMLQNAKEADKGE